MADRHEINKEEMFRKIMPSAAAERDAAAEAQSGGMMSDDAIAAAFAAAQGAAEPESAPSSGGTMSEDAIAAAFAAAQGAAGPEPEPVHEQPSEAAEPAGGNGFMSEDAIAAAFAAANGEPPPEANGASNGGTMSEDAIAAAFAAAQNGSAPAPEAAEEPLADSAPTHENETPDGNRPKLVFSPDGDAPHPVNLMERIVDRYYPIYLERLDGCTCQRCRDDVSGITLNKIHPRYVTSEDLPNVEAANREMVTETVTALVKALFIVKRNPHHGEQAAMRR